MTEKVFGSLTTLAVRDRVILQKQNLLSVEVFLTKYLMSLAVICLNISKILDI